MVDFVLMNNWDKAFYIVVAFIFMILFFYWIVGGFDVPQDYCTAFPVMIRNNDVYRHTHSMILLSNIYIYGARFWAVFGFSAGPLKRDSFCEVGV